MYVDNIMTKIAEKISAQDIIKANSQAEAAEAQRIKQEAEQYKAQLEEIKKSADEYKRLLEDMKREVGEYKDGIIDVKQDSEAYLQKLEENQVKIHDVGVQVYRNVQAVVEKSDARNKEEFKSIREKLEVLQVACEAKGGTLVLSIITIILVTADLVLNVLRLFKII